MRIKHKLPLGLVFTLVLILVVSVHAVAAQSSGCLAWNGWSFGGSAGTTFGSDQYNSGEVFVYSYVASGVSAPTSVTMLIGGNPVDTDAVPGSVSYAFPATGIYLVATTVTGGLVDYVVSCTTGSGSGGVSRSSYVAPPCSSIRDSRVNDLPDRDCGAPVAIYSDSGIQVFGINPATGEGRLNVAISEATIEAAGVPTTPAVLLGQGRHYVTGMNIAVYRLSTGEFQLNTRYREGKPYIFVWDEAGNKYHLAS